MIMTITPVMIVSRRVGQTTLAVSAFTWLKNSNGPVFATLLSSLFKNARDRGMEPLPGPKEPAPSNPRFRIDRADNPAAPGKQETRPPALRTARPTVADISALDKSIRIWPHSSNFRVATRGAREDSGGPDARNNRVIS